MPDRMFGQLADHLIPVRLSRNEVLIEPLEPARTAHFLLEGLVSAARLLEDGSCVQLAMGGRGGFSGVSILTGAEIEETRTQVIVPGSALRIDADKLRAAMIVEPALQAHLQRFVSMLMSQVGISVSCNARHNAIQRVARWILTAEARTGSPELPVSQEIIGLMLGVRRSGVSEIVSQMRAGGAISTSRNNITVQNRRLLEQYSCECFREGEAARRRHSSSLQDSSLPPSELHALLDQYFAATEPAI